MKKLTILSTAAVLVLGLSAPASADPYRDYYGARANTGVNADVRALGNRAAVNTRADINARGYEYNHRDYDYRNRDVHPSHNASARAKAVASENARFNRDNHWDDRDHWNEDDRRDWRDRADRNWDERDGKWTTTADARAANRGSADYFRNDPRNNWQNDADRTTSWKDQQRWRDRDSWRLNRW